MIEGFCGSIATAPRLVDEPTKKSHEEPPLVVLAKWCPSPFIAANTVSEEVG